MLLFSRFEKIQNKRVKIKKSVQTSKNMIYIICLIKNNIILFSNKKVGIKSSSINDE